MKKKKTKKKPMKRPPVPPDEIANFDKLVEPESEHWVQSLRHVPRPARPPAAFKTKEYTEFRRELGEYWIRGGARQSQRRFDWDRYFEYINVALGPAVMKLFDNRCAFTGRPATQVGWFRPPSDTMEVEGGVWPEHYWWLTLEWGNLYPMSRLLISGLRSVFPVFGDRSRLPTQSMGRKPASDQAVFLDPCRDHHAFYVNVSRDGRLIPILHQSWAQLTRTGHEHLWHRSERTILNFSLNLESLELSRRWVRKKCSELLRSSVTRNSAFVRYIADYPVIESELQRAYVERWSERGHLDVPYPAQWVRRGSDFVQYLAADVQLSAELQNLGHPSQQKLSNEVELAQRAFLDSLPREFIRDDEAARSTSPRQRSVAPAQRRVAHEASADAALPAQAGATTKYSEEQRPLIGPDSVIERVTVKNFRSIREAELEFGGEREDAADSAGAKAATQIDTDEAHITGTAWTMLLGENGTGKSTWLQAVALAMLGDTLGEAPPTDSAGFWDEILREPRDPIKEDRPKQGRVKIEFRGGALIDFRFNTKKAWYHGPDPRINVPLRAYGATRLTPDPKMSEEDKQSLARRVDKSVRIENLFDPRAPIIDAQDWLLSLEDEEFNVAAIVLTDILGRGDNAGRPWCKDEQPPMVTRGPKEKRTWVRIGGDKLSQASDGYRSSVCLACDIMANLGKGFSEMRNATGTVLIDEIGAHLHPRWKMEFTRALRSNFSNVQFITTTHEPLCLKGLKEGEVTLVTKDPDHGAMLTRIDRSPSDLRPDQLLTSEFFGLHSLLDRELNDMFQEYYSLLAIGKDHLDDTQKARLDELKAKLSRRHQFGQSRRDQLVYDAIDAFIVEQEKQRKQPKTLDEKTKRTVLEIWGVSRGVKTQAQRKRGAS